MIGRLVGNVVLIEDSGLTLDVGGVGYETKVPAGTLGRTSTGGSDPVTLWVHSRQPRDGTLELFGFASEDERAMFRLLIRVKNVGPSVALKILGALSTADVVQAIVSGNPGPITAAPGVGKAKAEEVVSELKKKKNRAALPGLGPSAAAAAPSGDAKRLLGALTNLGYRPAEAERAVTSLGERVGREPVPELLRAALAVLA